MTEQDHTEAYLHSSIEEKSEEERRREEKRGEGKNSTGRTGLQVQKQRKFSGRRILNTFHSYGQIHGDVE